MHLFKTPYFRGFHISLQYSKWGVDKKYQIVHNISVNKTLIQNGKYKEIIMKVQKFEGLPRTNQVFKSHSNLNNTNNNKVATNKIFYDSISVDSPVLTDSIENPILPQIARKFKKAYNILFPAKVVKEAKEIRNQIDEFVDGSKFQAVA